MVMNSELIKINLIQPTLEFAVAKLAMWQTAQAELASLEMALGEAMANMPERWVSLRAC